MPDCLLATPVIQSLGASAAFLFFTFFAAIVGTGQNDAHRKLPEKERKNPQ